MRFFCVGTKTFYCQTFRVNCCPVIHLYVTFIRRFINSRVCCRAAIELCTEAESHVRLNHDNIVQLYAMVFEKGHYGVVLEYVPRGGLDEFIFQNKVIMRSLSTTVSVLTYTGWRCKKVEHIIL